ncbi:MAG: hypothetical protein CMG08_04695 [Candidatus Marinimicrobia bacterium]|nr:hypothetical protein [Candidatus Neomarinimicrobiota bacterium]
MKIKYLFLSLFIFLSSNLLSQQMDENGIYLQAEKMPAIKGGMKEIGRKIQYPSIAKEMGIQGVVYVGFVVDAKGMVVDAKVLRPVAKLLDKEALRLVTKDVKFTPGYHEGKPVPVKMVIPIRFRL